MKDISIQTRLKIFSIKLIWFLSKFFYLFPLDKNKVFFLSYNGEQYSDSPRYISDYYLKNKKDIKIVWGFDKTFDKSQIQIPKEIETYKKGSFAYIYHLMTAKEIVVNDFISTAFQLRKKQILLNTWHGGGTFKTIGMTRNTLSDYDEFFFKAHAQNTSAYVLSSNYFKETVVTKSFLFLGETIKCGLPRNAVLFQDGSEIRHKVLHKYGIDNKKPELIVLYAPTYRDYTKDYNIETEKQFINLNECKKAFEKRFGKKVTFFSRAHHLMSMNSVCGENIDVTDYPDMQELIIASDILISDYSSCMWDFALTKKPIFVYAPDLEQYESDIDFFMPARKWAFPLACDNKELVNNIISFNMEKYLNDLSDYMKPLGSYEGPDSIKLICNWLDEKRKESK